MRAYCLDWQLETGSVLTDDVACGTEIVRARQPGTTLGARGGGSIIGDQSPAACLDSQAETVERPVQGFRSPVPVIDVS